MAAEEVEHWHAMYSVKSSSIVWEDTGTEYCTLDTGCLIWRLEMAYKFLMENDIVTVFTTACHWCL